MLITDALLSKTRRSSAPLYQTAATLCNPSTDGSVWAVVLTRCAPDLKTLPIPSVQLHRIVAALCKIPSGEERQLDCDHRAFIESLRRSYIACPVLKSRREIRKFRIDVLIRSP